LRSWQRNRMKRMLSKIWKALGIRILFAVSLGLFTLSLADFGVSKLPKTFESTSILTVTSINVDGTSDDDLAQRISTMNNEILSRSQLEPMITKYELYQDEKSKGISVEQIIEKMKRNIEVEPEKKRFESKYKSFRIKFSCDNAGKAQQVTADLASKYVSTQIDEEVNLAELKRDLLDKKVKDAKSQLKKLKGQKLRDAKIAYQNLLSKQNNSQMCLDCSATLRPDVAFSSVGSTIKVRDAANLPTDSPNRLKLDLIGAGFGFILGLVLVWFAQIIEARKPQLR
jgi:hypothetical protein